MILGLGGGTVVQIIRQYWPESKITAIEIDPEIIKVGRRYFDLGEIENLKIINADAIKWRRVRKSSDLQAANFNDISGLRGLNKRQKRRGVFDLIIVDLYLGSRFPKKAENDEFFKYLKKFLAPDRVIIFNRLRQRGEKFSRFEKKIKSHFSSVKKLKTVSNLFFIAGFS